MVKAVKYYTIWPKAEKQIIKKVYFETADILNPRTAGAVAGGSVGGNLMKPTPVITVRPQKEQP